MCQVNMQKVKNSRWRAETAFMKMPKYTRNDGCFKLIILFFLSCLGFYTYILETKCIDINYQLM